MGRNIRNPGLDLLEESLDLLRPHLASTALYGAWLLQNQAFTMPGRELPDVFPAWLTFLPPKINLINYGLCDDNTRTAWEL